MHYITPLLLRGTLCKCMFVLLLVVIAACNPARRVLQGQHLLNSITIKSDNIIENLSLDKDELLKIAKQKPNRTLLLQSGPRFYLYAYNFGVGLKSKRINNFFSIKVGEPPVIIDTVLTKRTSKQMNNYLHNKGYFLSKVTDTTFYNGKKANVQFKISAGKAYTINSYKIGIDDSVINEIVTTSLRQSFLKPTTNYNVTEIELERERVTKLLKNNGFYFFDKEFIKFDADSNLNNTKVDLTMRLNRLTLKNDTLKNGNTTPFYLRQYTLNKIYVDLDYNPLNAIQTKSDTELVRGYTFVYNKQFLFTRQIIRRSMFFEQGRYYSMQDVEDTYKSFADLRTFKFINIQLTKDNSDSSFDYLNVHVQLSPSKFQNFDVSIDGTNTGIGNFGLGGTFRLQNKNLLQGAETYELKLRGGVEAQQLLSDSSIVKQQSNFNTILIAPELNVTIPKHFLFTRLNKLPAIYKPRTKAGVAFNYQNRPDYESTLFNTTFAGIYKFKPRWILFFPQYDISYAKYTLSNALSKRFENNERLSQAFSNVFITSFKVAVEKSSQEVSDRGNYHYFKAGLEVAGTLTYLYNKYVQKSTDTNEVGNYIFFGDKLTGTGGSAYANFSKIDLEYRFFNPIGRKSSFVYRLLGGATVPYLNSGKVVPYTKSYFIGGSNDLRAWDARNLGPGGFGTNNSSNLNRIGDLKLEANAEIRFPIYKIFKGAFFVDAGNIWLLYPDKSRKKGNFDINNAFPQKNNDNISPIVNVAVGTGAGIRLDFTYVILRFDFATRIVDPEGPNGNTWAAPHLYSKAWREQYESTNRKINSDINGKLNDGISDKQLRYQHININFGIGYPF
jgi:hypothetical protein